MREVYWGVDEKEVSKHSGIFEASGARMLEKQP